MSAVTTSSELFKSAANTIAYDEKMIAVPKAYDFGFFPGGRGTIDKSDTIAGKKVMVLGQDYDTEAKFAEAEETRDGNKTWRGIDKLLSELNIKPEDCFFTNAYMGLRKRGKNTGPNPGGNDYKESCRTFLKQQIEVVAPKVILVLGLSPLKYLAATYPGLPAAWRSATTVTSLLQSAETMHAMLEVEGQKILVALVIHPCMNATNRTKIFGKKDTHREVAQLEPLLEKVLG